MPAGKERHLTHIVVLQALRVLQEMQQRTAFTSLLQLSLGEAAKVNGRAQAAHMQSLDLSMHIAAGSLPSAWGLGQQVLCSLVTVCDHQA